MSKAWSARTAAQRKRLEAAFVLRHGIDVLLDEQVERIGTTPERAPRPLEPGERPAFARLYRALRNGDSLPVGLSAALAADPALRADFSLLLERCAIQHLPRAAAAASADTLARREADGCTVRLVSSRAGDAQVYLLIELPDTDTGESRSTAPGRLVVKTAAGAFLIEELPPPETRTIRLLKAADDPVVQAVGEPASEIFLL